MSFESACFQPIQIPYARVALEAWLDASPVAYADPFDAGTWHLSATPALARHAFAARQADRTRHPFGVLVRLREADVLIDQRGDEDTLAQARAFVEWLLQLGRWRVVTEAGDQGELLDAAGLYSGVAVPPPPSPVGRTWTWRTPRGEVSVRLPDGAVIVDGRDSGPLDPASRDEFSRVVEGLDFVELDRGAEWPDTVVEFRWEEGGEEDVAYFDSVELPPLASPVAAWFERIRQAHAGP